MILLLSFLADSSYGSQSPSAAAAALCRVAGTDVASDQLGLCHTAVVCSHHGTFGHRVLSGPVYWMSHRLHCYRAVYVAGESQQSVFVIVGVVNKTNKVLICPLLMAV